MNGQNRKDIHPGLPVAIILKKDQRSGKLAEGIVGLASLTCTFPHSHHGLDEHRLPIHPRRWFSSPYDRQLPFRPPEAGFPR